MPILKEEEINHGSPGVIKCWPNFKVFETLSKKVDCNLALGNFEIQPGLTPECVYPVTLSGIIIVSTHEYKVHTALQISEVSLRNFV